MKSLIIGIARTGKPSDQVLNPDMRYISMYGSYPEVSFSIDCGQYDFLTRINDLRYRDADPTSSADAISFFENLTTRVIQDLKYLTIDDEDSEPLHLRLVTSPLELAQIPFEFARLPGNASPTGNVSLLTNPKKLVTLTREVRQESEASYTWPPIARILFAWAAPSDHVPHDEQLEVLKAVLEPLVRPLEALPYPEPDAGFFLTELPNASLQAIAKEISKAILEKRPYTHVNILAHGGRYDGVAGPEFRLVLCQDGSTDKADKVDGKKLVQSLVRGKGADVPTVVSLSACDSGNMGNTIVPAGSLVYQLHNAGIPCVFASQFPLTQPGSVKMVNTLYSELINGCDPRVALYNTRVALKEDQNHDWASLVAYARFPENIDQQLQTTRLKMLFGAMKTTNAWVDHVFRYREKIPLERREQALKMLEQRLERCIHDLSGLLTGSNKNESTLATESLRAEHLGLLASAYKRKAEYHYRLIEFNPDQKAALMRASTDALNKAKDFYQCGFEANAASHWNAMQYLSLKTALEGSLQDENEIWTIIKFMAQREEKHASGDTDRIWPWATLLELYMLKPLTLSPELRAEAIKSSLATCRSYMTRMINTGQGSYVSEKESTARQLERYINWWPELSPGTFPLEVREMAIEIRSMLPEFELLLAKRAT